MNPDPLQDSQSTVLHYVQKMFYDGLFAEHPEHADAIFLTHLPNHLLNHLFDFLTHCDSLAGREEIFLQRGKDLMASFIFIESIRSLSKGIKLGSFDFSSEFVMTLAVKYKVAVVLEKSRREGFIRVDYLNKPLEDWFLQLTNKGREELGKMKIEPEPSLFNSLVFLLLNSFDPIYRN